MRASLASMAAGGKGTVVSLPAQAEIRQRLAEMGFTRGTLVEVVRFAPMGDPVEVRVRGYCLTLRKSEAEGIELEVGP